MFSWIYMRSLQKSFIMWTFKALTASSSLASPIRGTINQCVHSVKGQYYRGLATATNNVRTSELKMGQDGRLLLNVHSLRPFSSIHSYCAERRQDVDVQNSVATSVSKSNSPETNHVVQNKYAEDYSDEDEDEEELRKEMIWDVGPTLPPSFNFAAYANESEVVQKLVGLGVDLSKLENKYGIMPFMLKLDFDANVTPFLRFLVDNGVPSDRLGWYLTRNPFILKEDLQNLGLRLEYLSMKKFTDNEIERIINTNPYWLSFSVNRIDRRLGFFQTFFGLSGNQVRTLSVKGPKLITSNLGRVKDVTFTVKEEMGFNRNEIISLLLDSPRIWREKPDAIRARFDYLHNTVKFSHEAFVVCPQLLLTRESKLRKRIGFLQSEGRAQFDPEQPNYVTFKMIYERDDAEFATKVARSSVLKFNEYLKNL